MMVGGGDRGSPADTFASNLLQLHGLGSRSGEASGGAAPRLMHCEARAGPSLFELQAPCVLTPFLPWGDLNPT